jgi:hypothetical protein
MNGGILSSPIMRRFLVAIVSAWMFPTQLFGQGQVLFANRVGTIVDAPVTIHGSNPLVGPGPGFTAALLLVNANGALTPLAPMSTFHPSGPGAEAIADRYWFDQLVEVPGVQPGTPATFIVRAWRTAFGSFENAVSSGESVGQSAPFTIAVGGNTLPPANLTTLQPFNIMFLPEPSVLSLGIVGALGLFVLRRNNGISISAARQS